MSDESEQAHIPASQPNAHGPAEKPRGYSGLLAVREGHEGPLHENKPGYSVSRESQFSSGYKPRPLGLLGKVKRVSTPLGSG